MFASAPRACSRAFMQCIMNQPTFCMHRYPMPGTAAWTELLSYGSIQWKVAMALVPSLCAVLLSSSLASRTQQQQREIE